MSVVYPEQFLAASEGASSQRGQNLEANEEERRGRTQERKEGGKTRRDGEGGRETEDERERERQKQAGEKIQKWKNKEAKDRLLCDVGRPTVGG